MASCKSNNGVLVSTEIELVEKGQIINWLSFHSQSQKSFSPREKDTARVLQGKVLERPNGFDFFPPFLSAFPSPPYTHSLLSKGLIMIASRALLLVWSHHFTHAHIPSLYREKGYALEKIKRIHSDAGVFACMHLAKKKCYSWMQCDSFVFVCISGWLWADFPLRCNLGLWCSEEKEERKQQTWREERERGRWYRWERKSTSSHTETINKLSSQSISYGLASVIALCQSRVSAAWE